MAERNFELKLATGKVVTWPGQDGEDASRRYVDCHPGQAVIAWREPSAQGTIEVLGDTSRIIG